MGLSYILRRVASQSGLNNLIQNPAQKARIVDVVNVACEELWEETDLAGSLEEFTVLVNGCQEIAFPAYVGELRAVREKCLMEPWTLKDMRPRYQNQPWTNMWKTWRIKGYNPLQRSIVNTAPLTFTIVTPDSTEVTVVGSTSSANRVSDTIAMTAPSVVGTVSFESIEAIVKSGANDEDITVKDAQDNVMAVLFNDSEESRYIIVDVSEYPWGTSTSSTGQIAMEILFKKKLKKLVNDNDTFPVPDYDNVIITKVLQLLAEGQEGKEQRALLLAQKADILIKNKQTNKEGELTKPMQFGSNPFYGLNSNDYSGGHY